MSASPADLALRALGYFEKVVRLKVIDGPNALNDDRELVALVSACRHFVEVRKEVPS